MAAASYTTDISGITTADTGTFIEPTATNWGQGATPSNDTDNYIQGTSSQSKAFNATGVGGIIFDRGTPVTIPSPGGFSAWVYWASPQTLENESAGGIRLICGSAANAFRAWTLGGKDTYAYGGWTNFVADPTVSGTYTAGAVTANKQFFGMAVNNTVSIIKGSPCLLDMMYTGRFESRFSGGDLANGYATFPGFSTINDTSTNRWGLIQELNGTYQIKGLVVFGYGSAVDFRDANRSIFIQNTKQVTSTFNGFEVRQATSRVDLTAISVTSLGTVSRGYWTNTDNATVNLANCSFTDMDTFTFQSNTTSTGTTFRRCNIVTQGNSQFTSCTFDSSRSTLGALVTDNPDKLDYCTFTAASGITSHGIILASGCAGGSYTLTGDIFTGYAGVDGSTGSEAVYNNSGGAVTLAIAGGGTVPSVRNGSGASTNVTSNSVSVSVLVKDVDNNNINGARALLLANTGGPMPYNVTVSGISNSGTTATVTHLTAHGLLTNDKVQIKGASLWQNNGVFTITVSGTNNYTYTLPAAPGSNPTGTIKCTFAPLYGTTASDGTLTTSRVYSSLQPITGKVRKSSSAPFYKTTTLTGGINSSTGYSATIQLISDE